MDFLLGALIVAVAVAAAVAAMLAVRRRAPEGSYFSDGDRASGVFGVLATGFSLLLIGVLDKPYRSGPGRLQPVAMERTLLLIDQARGALGQDDPLPCDAEGRPA